MIDVPYTPDEDKPAEKKRPGQDRHPDEGRDPQPDRTPQPGREPRQEPQDDRHQHAPVIDEPASVSRNGIDRGIRRGRDSSSVDRRLPVLQREKAQGLWAAMAFPGVFWRPGCGNPG